MDGARVAEVRIGKSGGRSAVQHVGVGGCGRRGEGKHTCPVCWSSHLLLHATQEAAGAFDPVHVTHPRHKVAPTATHACRRGLTWRG